jgi:hypothetical protein
VTDADHFEFNGHGVSIDYTPLGAGAVPHLTFQDGRRKLQFSGDEIRMGNGGLRGALTIDLERRIGLNTDTFTLFVPEVHVADGQRAEITTVAITTETLGGALPDTLPLPIDHFTAIQLDGFAEKRTGILPLSDA